MDKIEQINHEIAVEREKFRLALVKIHALKLESYELCEEIYGHDFSDDPLNCSLCGIVNDSLLDKAMDAYEDYRAELAIDDYKERL